jgi:CBS domain containing-hemolysin-like protein
VTTALLAAALTTADIWMLVAIVVLLVITTFLALSETALTRMPRTKAQALAESSGRRGAHLLWLVAKPERFLNPVLLTLLICQIVQATLLGLVADHVFGGWGVAVATVVNVVVVFTIAEAAPKTWAIQHPERAALMSAGPVRMLARFWPIRVLSRGLIGMANVLLPGKGLKEGPFVSEEELLALASVAVEEEVIEEEERDLIAQIIEFGDTVVREVMVPRPDMVTVSADFRVDDVMEVMILNGFSRVPAIGEGIDDIIGVVYAKDLMRAGRDGQGDRPVSELMRTAQFVPETKRVAELLPEMQAAHVHLAVVVDEYGGTAGLVTLEDVIEELVGEIHDEYDREVPMLQRLEDGTLLVNAAMPIDELNEHVYPPLPEDENYDSVGGLIYHLLGHVAAEGDAVVCEGHRLQAEQVARRRIGRVRIESARRHPAADEDGPVLHAEGRADGDRLRREPEAEAPPGPAEAVDRSLPESADER